MTTSGYTIEQLAEAANAWCEQHQVVPASGQAGERLTERNIRYYRTLGLVDPPLSGGGAGYQEKHRMQLVAIRLLQAQGLPLNRIRDLLFGRTVEELSEIERRGLTERARNVAPAFHPAGAESWTTTPLDDEFLLISRRGRGISEVVRKRLLAVLEGQPGSRARGSTTKDQT